MASMCKFASFHLGSESPLDETTVCTIYHLLEHNKLGTRSVWEVGRDLQLQALRVSPGTMMDVTIITTEKSTKNASG